MQVTEVLIQTDALNRTLGQKRVAQYGVAQVASLWWTRLCFDSVEGAPGALGARPVRLGPNDCATRKKVGELGSFHRIHQCVST